MNDPPPLLKEENKTRLIDLLSLIYRLWRTSLPLLSTAAEFWEACPSGRLASLDVGQKTIGLGLSDPTYLIASPLETFYRKKWTEDGPLLLALFAKNNVSGLVIGWPLNMDGSRGPRCHATHHFTQNLLALRNYPVIFWDERLSTISANRILRDEADLSRQKRAPLVDTIAATLILQSFICTKPRPESDDHGI